MDNERLYYAQMLNWNHDRLIEEVKSARDFAHGILIDNERFEKRIAQLEALLTEALPICDQYARDGDSDDAEEMRPFIERIKQALATDGDAGKDDKQP